MTTQNNGGPAFPVIAENVLGHVSDGLSIRDYFAAMALQGMLSCERVGTPELFYNPPACEDCRTGVKPDWAFVVGTSLQVWAKNSYDIADAMLAQRDK